MSAASRKRREYRRLVVRLRRDKVSASLCAEGKRHGRAERGGKRDDRERRRVSPCLCAHRQDQPQRGENQRGEREEAGIEQQLGAQGVQACGSWVRGDALPQVARDAGAGDEDEGAAGNEPGWRVLTNGERRRDDCAHCESGKKWPIGRRGEEHDERRDTRHGEGDSFHAPAQPDAVWQPPPDRERRHQLDERETCQQGCQLGDLRARKDCQ